MSEIKPHLSASQLDMACRCGEQYRRRYMEREIIAPGIAMLKGSAVHKGAETNFRQKIESHEDLPVNDIVDAAVASLDAAAHGEVSLTDDELSIGFKNVIGAATDSVRDMAKIHAEQQAPDYQPVMVEQAVRIELPDSPRDYLGVLDLVDDQDRVIDLKTAKRKKSQNDADSSVQLTGYGATFKALNGRDPKELILDTIIQGKKETTRQTVSTTRSEADYAALAERINAVNASIAAGIFLPATPGAWNCSPRWCGYFTTCKFVNAERAAKAQEDE